jgi:hypothetical protein
MKIAARCLIAVVMLAAASFAFAHPFKSKIITTEPLMITVGDDAILRIKNFSQEGGTDRGVVSVTLTGENGGTANVLVATRTDFSTGADAQNFPEIGNQVIIAGPAQVTVAPITGATLFITFRKESNEGSGGGGIIGFVSPTPSPFPFLSPTPTPTPTPSASPPMGSSGFSRNNGREVIPPSALPSDRLKP